MSEYKLGAIGFVTVTHPEIGSDVTLGPTDTLTLDGKSARRVHKDVLTEYEDQLVDLTSPSVGKLWDIYIELNRLPRPQPKRPWWRRWWTL